jgi:5-methyltetrahydropteroyltriglutamate--homocysteine methyltransferase
MSHPLLPVTGVGSWPRTPQLLRAQRQKRAGRLAPEEFSKLADEAVLEVLRLQEDAGAEIVTDGEQRRDSFFSFIAEKLDGVAMMTLSEMLEIVDDKASFEQILQTLDVPASSISNATCVGKVRRRAPLAVEELAFLKRHTTRPVKIPLPGPYLITRAMFVKEVSRAAYATKEELGEDIIAVLRAELADLLAGGVDFIQLDEPVLTELVFTQGRVRTFMCAALAASKNPAEELEFAVYLMNRVLEGFDGARVGLHVCRGNWSTDESTLLSGNYRPLAPYFARMKVDQLVLEYATERAGELLVFADKELGLGVVNPRTETIESVEEIARSIERALEVYEPTRLFLNPDCGFATFSHRPVNTHAIAAAKMKKIAEAAALVRGSFATK